MELEYFEPMDKTEKFIKNFKLGLRLCNINIRFDEAVNIIAIAELVREKGENATIKDFIDKGVVADVHLKKGRPKLEPKSD